MPSRSKLIMVGLVLAAGVAGALTFRHREPQLASQPSTGLERRASDTPDGAAGESRLLGHIESEPGSEPHAAETPATPLPAAAPVITAPPPLNTSQALAPTVSARATPAPAGMPADSPWSASGHSLGAAGHPASTAGEPLAVAAGPRRPRTPYKSHRVKDGDTLSSLAQHYLGDGQRWSEIYELNRDLLRDPDILPIGARVKIPELGPAPLPPAADIVAAPRGPQASLASERSMVAIEAPPTPATVAPLVPLAPGAYRAARDRAPAATYRVQPRDTLVSIARQLYGDESRFQEIYEANRALIPDPNNLRAGVVLSVP